MKNYIHTKRTLFSGPHLVGMLFMGAGVFTLLSPAFMESDRSFGQTLFIGIAMLSLGISIVSFYEGTTIDFQQKKVKAFTTFMGYRFGQWETLPAIKKIDLVPISYTATNTPNGISPTLSGRVREYNVFLYSDNPKAEFSFNFSKEDRAEKTARLISANLGVDYEVKKA